MRDDAVNSFVGSISYSDPATAVAWAASITDERQRNNRMENAARNWMWMTPELGQYLHDHARSKVQAAVDEYERITHYWFVSGFQDTTGEAIHEPLYDVLLLQAKAWVLQQPATELARYLDVPAFARGDLLYIQNLIAVIAAASSRPG